MVFCYLQNRKLMNSTLLRKSIPVLSISRHRATFYRYLCSRKKSSVAKVPVLLLFYSLKNQRFYEKTFDLSSGHKPDRL